MAKSKGTIIPPFVVGDQSYPWGGLNTATKDNRFLYRGDTNRQLNWITGRDRDHIELRRGSIVLGKTTRNIAGAKVTGLGIGIKNNGDQVPFYTFNRSIFYYDKATNDTIEIGTNILPAIASGEFTSFMPYQNLAGSFIYLTSLNSSIYKLSVANLGSIIDLGSVSIGVFTVTIASPAVFTRANHGFVAGDMIQFTTTGALPTGLLPNTTYYVIAAGLSANNFRVSATLNGVAVNTSGTQSGVHTVVRVTDVINFHFNFAKINRGYMFGMNRRGADPTSNDITGLYLSTPDDTLSLPRTNIHIGTGDGSNDTFPFSMTETPVQPGSIFINDSVEFFTDDGAGVLTGSLGGSGTINYTTGAGSITFNIAPAFSAQIDGDYVQNNQSTFSVGTGNGVLTTFSGTIVLPFPKTAYFVSITDTRETFRDDKNGLLIGTLGGTGTINYITGAYSVTFNTAPANTQAITGTNFEEDSTDSGVADFTGIGSDIFRQDDGGGEAVAVWPYQGVEYSLHKLRSWLLTIDVNTDPVSFDNEPYYEQIGIPNVRSAFPTGEGILFLNNALPSQPKFSILEIPAGSTNLTVVPTSLSDNLDLSPYGIDNAIIFRWGDWDFLAIKDNVNGQHQLFNGVTFIRNTTSKIWNKLDFYIDCAADFEGMLIAGSSISANVFELFSGFDDSNTSIANYHFQAPTDLEIEGLKKVNYLHFAGLIQRGQNLDVFLSLDNGEYVYIFTISGTGPYVSSQVVAIGTQGIGTGVVGGGFDGQAEYASRYEVDIPIHTDLFEYISWGIQATGIGFVSVERQEWKDPRFKRRRLFPYEDSEIGN